MITVSICCQTYNHVKYIKDCLEGFVKQKTNFNYEILIHDDASTDGTTKILKHYESKYPDLFKCIYQAENQFGKQNTLINFLLPIAQGKYIALCEGDDFWIDEMKLQKQVDFLESHPDFAACYHGCKFVNEINDVVKESKSKNYSSFNSVDLLCSEGAMITHAVLYRNHLKFPCFMDDVPNGDAFFWHLIGFHGHAKFISEIEYSAYRVHSSGVWTSSTELKRLENFLVTKSFILKNLINHFPDRNDYFNRLKETVFKEFSNYFYKQLYYRNFKEYIGGYKLALKFKQFNIWRVIINHFIDLFKRLFKKK